MGPFHPQCPKALPLLGPHSHQAKPSARLPPRAMHSISPGSLWLHPPHAPPRSQDEVLPFLPCSGHHNQHEARGCTRSRARDEPQQDQATQNQTGERRVSVYRTNSPQQRCGQAAKHTGTGTGSRPSCPPWPRHLPGAAPQSPHSAGEQEQPPVHEQGPASSGSRVLCWCPGSLAEERGGGLTSA